MIGLSESSYYYKERTGKRGRKPSNFTRHSTKGMVCESEVLMAIKKILEHEFIDCGHRVMCAYLKRDGYQINHKKVYRIMKSAGLIKSDRRIQRSGQGRKFVKYRKVKTDRPLHCLEMDIKMVWIPAMGKNAYLLSIIDVHTRKILKDLFSWTIKKKDVINLLSNLIDEYQYPENVVIRSDNGSQFITKDVREFLALVNVDQEFTHIATPEENAHIEAYHGTLKRDVFDRVEYITFGEIQDILKRYVLFYNNKRIHGLLGNRTPSEKWELDKHMIITKQKSA